jgi:cell division protein FtsW
MIRRDKWLICSLFLAALLGTLAIWNASYPAALKRGEAILTNDVIKHLAWIVGSAIIFSIISSWNSKKIRILGWVLFITTFAACALVLVPGFGISISGSTRWIGYGEFRIQPSEFMKTATVLFIALAGTLRYPRFKQNWRGWPEFLDHRIVPLVARIVPFFLVLIAAILIEREPDLGTAAMVMLIMFGVWCSGVGQKIAAKYYKYITALLIIVGVLGGFFFAFSEGYRAERIKLHAERRSPGVMDRTGYQPFLAEQALANGGPLGAGIGAGRAKYVLPATTTDYIYIPIAEEFGIWGSWLVFAILMAIVFRLFYLSRNMEDSLQRSIVCGTAWWIGAQTIINLLMVTALIAPIGIPLPLISYGGSSLLALSIALGAAQASLIHQSDMEGQTENRRYRRRHRRTRFSSA